MKIDKITERKNDEINLDLIDISPGNTRETRPKTGIDELRTSDKKKEKIINSQSKMVPDLIFECSEEMMNKDELFKTISDELIKAMKREDKDNIKSLLKKNED